MKLNKEVSLQFQIADSDCKHHKLNLILGLGSSGPSSSVWP